MFKAIAASVLLVCAIASIPVAAAQGTNGVVLAPSSMTVNYQIGSLTLPAAQTMTVTTTPKGLNYTVAISGAPFNAAWLLVSASSGVGPGTLKVTTNPTGLAAGTYAGVITVTATSGSTSYTQVASVTLLVASAPAAIAISPSALNFTYTTGGPVPGASLASAFIVSSSGSPLSATLSIAGATWLSINPTGDISLLGLFNTVAVTVNPTGLTPKVYTGTIKVSAPASTNKTVSMTVTLTVKAAAPSTVYTWPVGAIQGAGPTIATLYGGGFFANSTVTATGFTPSSTITATDGTNTVSSTFQIPVYQNTFLGLRLALSSPMPSGVVNAVYSQNLAAAGGTGPYTYSMAAGLLPAGITIGSGKISGTPTTAGTYAFVVGVTDSSTPSVTSYNQVSVTVDPVGATALLITPTAPLALGQQGSIYGPATLTAAGGTGGPYSWSATNLPPGMTLSAAGVLGGSPTTDGSAGPLAASVVSDTAMLVTIPAISLANAGLLRMAVTTPAPGGGVSNEAAFQIYGPNPQVTAVVNSASYLQGTVAPGDVIAIFGIGMGPNALTIFDPSAPPIPTSLPAIAPSTSVTINGTAAPIIYTSATVVGVIVPYTVSGATASIVATYGGLASQPVIVTLAAADPGIYSLASSGLGQGAILNFLAGDYSVNSISNPAAKGSVVIIYATGLGATTSATYNQLIPISPAVTPAQPPTVSIGGVGATVLAAQAPMGSIPGLMQLNVTVPSTVKAGGTLPVIVTVGGVASQAGLTMAVK
jgi:trimeric autotransporter adhesin